MRNPQLYYLFAFCLLFSNCSQVEKNFQNEENLSMHPEWEEQWKFLKLEKGKEAPNDFSSRMREEVKSKAYQRGASNLENIQEIGPDNIGGRTRAFMVDASSPDRFLAGGVSGGIWESLDRGASWNSLSDNEGNLSVTFLEQNPFNPNIVYYSTGESAGNSAGVSGVGLFKSIDGGKSFDLLESTQSYPFYDTWRVKCSKVDSNTLFVCGAYGLMLSEDGGASFERIYFQEVSDIECFPDGSIIIAERGEGLFKSAGKDDDYTFSQLPIPDESFTRIEIAYCASQPHVIYAAAVRNGGTTGENLKNIYKSDDGGLSWNTTAHPLDFGIGARFGYYCLSLEVHPDNPDLVFHGTNIGTYSVDGGVTWKPFYIHPDIHLFYIDPIERDVVYIGTDGGLDKFRYNSETEELIFDSNMNRGFNVTQFYAGSFHPTQDVVLGGTQDNGNMNSVPGTESFYWISGGDGSYNWINQNHSDTAFISTQYGNLYRSANFNSLSPGWQPATNGMLDVNGRYLDGAYFINPFGANPFNQSQLFLHTPLRTWTSMNSGTLWYPITEYHLGQHCYAVDKNSNGTNLIIGGSEGLLLKIENLETHEVGEEVLINHTIPTEVATSFVREMVFHPVYDSVLFVCMSSFSEHARVWKISDLLSENPIWENISGDLPIGLPVNDIEVHPQDENVLVIGTDYGVYTTENGGENWVLVDEIPAVATHQVRLRSTDNKVFVFTHGRGAWMGDLLSSSILNRNEVFEIDIALFPNPTSQWIQYNVPEDEELARVEIYSLSGQRVLKQTVLNQFGQSRTDVSNLSKGQYVMVHIFESGKKGRTQFAKIK